MRIPLSLIKKRNGELSELWVTAACRTEGCRCGIMAIDFVLDTGSSTSFVSYKDALNFNIPLNSLKSADHYYIAGGTYSFRKFPKLMVLAFKDDKDELVRLKMDPFYAVKPTKAKENAKEDAERLPSVLGLDFLVKNGLAFHFDSVKGTAYFEKS